MYNFTQRCKQLYELLQDERSKDIFKARVLFDIEPSMTNAVHFISLREHLPPEEIARHLEWKDAYHSLPGKVILYGTGKTGLDIANLLKRDGVDFYGFCGRRAKEFSGGLLGKPVITPEFLMGHPDDFFVVVAASGPRSIQEITSLLRERFPDDHIFHNFDDSALNNNQYFDFPSLYHKGTAFIDGGCFDGTDSLRFAEWCEGQYSDIIAFEPDPGNYERCLKTAEDNNLRNFHLIQAGLASCEGRAAFDARSTDGSRILSSAAGDTNAVKEEISIRTAAIDDIVNGKTVGFIKMDIEGAEFDALHGAKDTITRDKPLLAICVYHLQGDMLAIIDYLHQLVPEYRFWLRHYGRFMYDTVLYASVDQPAQG